MAFLQKLPLKRSPKVTITVTRRNIFESTERDSSHCMIAEAIRQAFPGAIKIAVDLQTIRFSDPDHRLRYTYLTPRIAQVALVNFDQGLRPKEFLFTLKGGQVTRMSVQKKRGKALSSTITVKPHEVVPDNEISSKSNAPKSKSNHDSVPRMESVRPYEKKTFSSKPSAAGAVPTTSGGTPPPLSSFARRREFGLRALQR